MTEIASLDTDNESDGRTASRPQIICHMVTSIDGRLIVERWTPPVPGASPDIIATTYGDTDTRLGAAGFMAGRVSFEAFPGVRRDEPRLTDSVVRDREHVWVADPNAHSFGVVFDPQAKLRYERNTIPEYGKVDSDAHVVAVLSERVSPEYLDELRDGGISYILTGDDGRNLRDPLVALRENFGVERILLEGGGSLNGAFLKAGLIDEISVVVYPGIDGLAGIPSIFDYQGDEGHQPASGKTLRHLATETMFDGLVWLRYAVEDASSGPIGSDS